MDDKVQFGIVRLRRFGKTDMTCLLKTFPLESDTASVLSCEQLPHKIISSTLSLGSNISLLKAISSRDGDKTHNGSVGS